MTSLDEKQALALWRDAEQAGAADDVRAAEARYVQLLDTPDFAVAAHLRLSLLAQKRGDLRDATRHALAAFERAPGDADALALLCKRLFSVGELEAAIRCASHPAIAGSRSVEILAETGKLMTDAFEPALALHLLDRARGLGLRTPAMAYLVGLARTYCGDLDGARDALEDCIRRDPLAARAHWARAKLDRATAEANAVDRMRAALARMGPTHRDAPLLHFALFKSFDELGDTAAAWRHLEAGMRARRSQVAYDPEQDRQLARHLLETTVRPLAPTERDEPGPSPVFIVGMPRTGTTLLEGIIGGHPAIADAGELHDVVLQLRWMCNAPGAPYLDLALARRAAGMDRREFGARYLAHTRFRAHGRRFYTDKMPANFANVGFILESIPDARILHMVRGPMDTCFSNLKELFAGAYPHSYDQREMAAHFLDYQALMAHWHRCAPGRILDVEYEALVAHPAESASRVFAHLGLDAAPGVNEATRRERSVATASAVQVREGIHARNVGQWERYATPLEPLRRSLEAGRQA